MLAWLAKWGEDGSVGVIATETGFLGGRLDLRRSRMEGASSGASAGAASCAQIIGGGITVNGQPLLGEKRQEMM